MIFRLLPIMITAMLATASCGKNPTCPDGSVKKGDRCLAPGRDGAVDAGPCGGECGGDTPVCLSSGECVECSEGEPDACSGATPVCDGETNTCVECTADDLSACGIEAPMCDTESHACVECTRDGESVCGSEGFCESGECRAVTEEWVRTFGDTNTDRTHALAVDGDGNIYIGGFFQGTVNPGDGELVGTTGERTAFLVSYDRDGSIRWQKAFAADRGAQVNDLDLDSSGNVYLAGHFQGPLSFEGMTFDSERDDTSDILVASFTSTGELRWVHTPGSASNDEANAIHAADGGRVGLAGTAAIGGGSIDFGAGARMCPLERFCGFVAAYGPTGEHRWSKLAQSMAFLSVGDVAVDPSGSVYLSGSADGISIGGESFSSAGEHDFFVAAFDPSGAHRWTTVLGGEANDFAEAVLLADDRLYVSGNFKASVTAAGRTVSSAGAFDGLLATIQPADGMVTMIERVGHGPGSHGIGLDALGSEADLYFHSSFGESVELGGETYVAADSSDVLYGRRSSTGELRWLRQFDGAAAVDLDGARRVRVAGHFSNTVELAGGERTPSGESDVFLLALGQ